MSSNAFFSDNDLSILRNYTRQNQANNCTLAVADQPTTDCNAVLTNSKININKVVFEDACCYQISVISNLTVQNGTQLYEDMNIEKAMKIYKEAGIPTYVPNNEDNKD